MMLILSLIANILSLMAQSAAVSPARILAARGRAEAAMRARPRSTSGATPGPEPS